ncbi:MAG: hypothetical protein WA364_13130 [Candidatus Nitrosopolaris sp.]
MAIIESNDPLVTLVSINNITIEVNGGTVFITEDGSERVIRISISLSRVTEDYHIMSTPFASEKRNAISYPKAMNP